MERRQPGLLSRDSPFFSRFGGSFWQESFSPSARHFPDAFDLLTDECELLAGDKFKLPGQLKVQQIAAYTYADTKLSDYEEDHLISLELGGSPTSPANLWPEPHAGTYGSFQKDKVENYLHAQVCAGKLSLASAQQEIATNWVKVYTSYASELASTSENDADDLSAASKAPTDVVATGQTVKLSTTGICHAPGDSTYTETIHFTPYANLQDCEAAGGRLPIN